MAGTSGRGVPVVESVFEFVKSGVILLNSQDAFLLYRSIARYL